MVVIRTLTVIMVDDENTVGFLSRMKFRHAIEDGSMDLHYFESGRECLTYLKGLENQDGDVVLFTDINMPQISGYDLLTEVSARHPKVSVYMMSAYEDSATIAKAKDLGAKGYFIKPVNFNEIKSLLHQSYGVKA